MKYRGLIRKIRKAAKTRGIGLIMKRQKGSHQMWICGSTLVVIPKHAEVNEITVEGIGKTLEAEFGRDWWR